MDYIKGVFKRMDLQQIRHYLLYGTEELAFNGQPYSDRLKNETDPIYNCLVSLYPDEKELDMAAADLSKALIAYESVHLELGMKAGARLMCQLLFTDDSPPMERSL